MREQEDIGTIFLTTIGQNIAKKRKEKGLSMEQLGLEIGLSRMQVNRIEKGYNITLITILKLSLALSVKPDELLKFTAKYKKEDLEKLVNTNKSSKIKIK